MGFDSFSIQCWCKGESNIGAIYARSSMVCIPS